MIKEFRPKYNVSFRDDKRFLLLKVHLDDAWPKFQLSRMRKEDGARYFGPFAHSGALRTTVAWVNRQFGLRSCRPLEPGEEDYKHCNDDVIRNCTAPCIGKIDREDYLKRVEEACVFLEGKSRDLLVELEEQMSKAAANLQFERAAELRDVLDHLRKDSSSRAAVHPDKAWADREQREGCASGCGGVEGGNPFRNGTHGDGVFRYFEYLGRTCCRFYGALHKRSSR